MSWKENNERSFRFRPPLHSTKFLANFVQNVITRVFLTACENTAVCGITVQSDRGLSRPATPTPRTMTFHNGVHWRWQFGKRPGKFGPLIYESDAGTFCSLRAGYRARFVFSLRTFTFGFAFIPGYRSTLYSIHGTLAGYAP